VVKVDMVVIGAMELVAVAISKNNTISQKRARSWTGEHASGGIPIATTPT
jgi:hypothetical protein